MNDHSELNAELATAIPADFVFDTEHPVLPVPFTIRIADRKFEGKGLSLTEAEVAAPGGVDDGMIGSKHIVKMDFNFEGFSIALFPEVRVAGLQAGELVLQFIDPTGPHLPQLRYILNSFIAGDFVSLGSVLSFTGPAKPKSAKEGDAAKVGLRDHAKRAGAILLSVALIAVALNALRVRYTQSYELRPVFIVRSGSEMKATSPGQITLLNPKAGEGDVVYAISSNSGDTLNFVLPCDCEVQVKDGIYEGATVLPSDPILTFFDSNVEVRVQTQMSIEGLTKAMNGEQVYLDLGDGRSVAVNVVQTSATNQAAQEGALYLPVVLLAEEPGALGVEDIGKPARVRLSSNLFDGLI